MLRRTLLAAAPLSVAFAGLPRRARAAEPLVFMSTQLRPIETAQALRNVILKDFARAVTFVPDLPPQLLIRMQSEMKTATHTVSLLAAVHGEMEPLVPLKALMPLDDVATALAGRDFSKDLMELGKFGTDHQLMIPWMQATYIMVANKKALPHLPAGADVNALTYAQLAAWAADVQQATGKRMLGFPAGPTGLMHRFFEGFLLPSYTGGVVTTFKSAAAETAWTDFAAMWKSVNPNSTNYNFMQEPLIAGDVWIAFDHVARVLDALSDHPDDFVAFPAPAGPKGRGWMPVLVGLSIPVGAPDVAGAKALIDYLTKPAVQITTAQVAGFFPVTNAELPADIKPGLRLAVQAIEETAAAKDGIASLLPVGLGTKSGEFDKIFMDTFQRIVLRGEKPRAVLDRQGDALAALMKETGAPCWRPDPPSSGACAVG
jgi:multiple sugar transport system substrate-binding protein